MNRLKSTETLVWRSAARRFASAMTSASAFKVSLGMVPLQYVWLHLEVYVLALPLSSDRWPDFHAIGSVEEGAPPPDGWPAHDGGRNQLHLDGHVEWIKKDIAP
jgi:prepilin-type processing-associated H-X9-DG protein